MKQFFLLLGSIIVLAQALAQNKQGSWQDYLSYSSARGIAVGNNKVFCGTEGGLFYIDLEDNSINKYSGLSDFSIDKVAFSPENNVLVVCYSNSNIDLVYGREVVNLSDIMRKTMGADKTINNVCFNQHYAYLACGFGIVVVDLQKKEIKDSYFIGDQGAAIAVNDVDFYKGYIYAATDEGLIRALAEGIELLDFNNWNRVEGAPGSSSKYGHITVHANRLLVSNYQEPGNDETYAFDGTDWMMFYSETPQVNELNSVENHLLVTSQQEVAVFDNALTLMGKIKDYRFDSGTRSPIRPNGSTIAPDGAIYVADTERALVKIAGENYESLFPAGPVDNEIFFLYSNNNDVWLASGGRDRSWTGTWKEPRFQRYRAGEWKNYSRDDIPGMSGFADIVTMVADPRDENHLFVGSWGGGLLEFRNDELVNRYSNHNSPLETALPSEPEAPYTRIGGLDFDSEGNLWISNSLANNNIHKLSPSGEWESFSMEKVTDKNVGQLVVNRYDDKWVVIPRGNNAYVVDKTGTRQKQLLVKTRFSNGNREEISNKNDVYSIAEDLDGAIWIGTSMGVAVYYNPSRVWDTEPYYGIQPGLDLNDGYYHPLLNTETVTAIAVDGANRKWMGTKNSGVFLISETGDEAILNFNTENSPILSNNILSIAVNAKTGEVFFGTDKGLISYQGEATGGSTSYSNVYAYPNPVRETYDGPVTITGLIEQTDIKITDISGNLVFKTTSTGGQAIWDGKNLNGKRVKTGVYLVFCNDKAGEETHVTKILFVN